MVWGQGMSGWTAAGGVAELQELLARLPPPIPIATAFVALPSVEPPPMALEVAQQEGKWAVVKEWVKLKEEQPKLENRDRVAMQPKVDAAYFAAKKSMNGSLADLYAAVDWLSSNADARVLVEPPPVPLDAIKAARWEAIKKVAFWHRLFVLSLAPLILYFVSLFFFKPSHYLDTVMDFFYPPLELWLMYRVVKALRLGFGWFFMAIMMIPVGSLVIAGILTSGLLVPDIANPGSVSTFLAGSMVLAWLSQKAIARLRDAGLSVGLFGALSVPDRAPDWFM